MRDPSLFGAPVCEIITLTMNLNQSEPIIPFIYAYS